MSDEYGRSAFDIRHSFTIGGNINMPWQVSLSPFIIASTGRPFNITQGVDINRDNLFTERPTFAELGAACVARGLTTSWCDVSGKDPFAIIPRNYGQSPGNFSVNLRVAKNFGFGGTDAVAAARSGGDNTPATAGGGRAGGRRGGGGGIPAGGGARGGGGRAGGGGGGGFGGFGGGGGDARKPYNLNIGLNFTNLFNTVNLGSPIGNIASGRFGQSTSTIGGFGGFGGGGFGGGSGSANRRIELQARFSW